MAFVPQHIVIVGRERARTEVYPNQRSYHERPGTMPSSTVPEYYQPGQLHPQDGPGVGHAQESTKTPQALLDAYSCEESFFRGTTSEHIGISKHDGTKVVVKRVAKAASQEAVNVRREIEVLKVVADPSLPILIEWLDMDDMIWTVQEHRDCRSIGSIVRATGPLSEDDTRVVMNQFFSAIASLFMQGFAHLHICDDTVYLDSYKQLTIKDLEFTCMYGREKEGDLYAPIQEKHGSSDIYVAPEVFSSHTYNARKAVIWSCGVLLYFMTTGQTYKLSNLEHPSFEKSFRDTNDDASASTRPKKMSVAHAQSKIIMYPSRFAVPTFARTIIPKMLIHDPRRRAELIEVASRVPKDFSINATRPLMELAWLDYKTHVGPNADLHIPDQGNASSASSVFSAVSRLSNPFASLLNRGEGRRKSAPPVSRYRLT